MKIKILYRHPDENHTAVLVDDVEHVLDLYTYIDIIKQCSRIDGTGKDYLECRNKLLIDYFTNGPKEKYSW